MSLLHKLMEKKDLKNYLKLRIKQLNYNIRNVPNHVKKEDRNEVIEKLKARREELEKLNHALSQNDIKGKSKEVWQFLYDKGEVEYEGEEKDYLTVEKFEPVGPPIISDDNVSGTDVVHPPEPTTSDQGDG